MASELERIERRLIVVEERQAAAKTQLATIEALLNRIVAMLEEPTTFPQSSGGTITVN